MDLLLDIIVRRLFLAVTSMIMIMWIATHDLGFDDHHVVSDKLN